MTVVADGRHDFGSEARLLNHDDRLGRSPAVGVVGLGYWGPNLLRVLVDRPDVRVRWLCDIDSARLERFARRYPNVERVTTRFEELLDDPELDAVLLATPVFTHRELAEASLLAGKHTFVEKPLASRAAEAARLIELAQTQGLELMCGHTFLYSPPVRRIGELLAAGELGEPYFISSSRVNLGLHQRDVSVVWDLGPHDFSILLSWLREVPRAIRATGRDSIVPGIADVAFVTMEFDSGLIANVELSWLAPSKLRRTVVVGSKKMVLYEDGGAEAVKIYDRGIDYRDPETFGEYQLSYRSGDILTPQLASDEPLALQLADFLAGVRGQRSDRHGLRLAYDVVRLAEAAERSLGSGGDQVAPAPAEALLGVG